MNQGYDITLKNIDGKFSVAIHRGDLTLDEVIEELVIPLLLASGFPEALVSERLRVE